MGHLMVLIPYGSLVCLLRHIFENILLSGWRSCSLHHPSPANRRSKPGNHCKPCFRTQVRSMGPDLCHSLLIELRLDTNWCDSILTDDAKRAVLSNMVLQVGPPGGQICNKCEWRQMVAKCLACASLTWWPYLHQWQNCGKICEDSIVWGALCLRQKTSN